MSVFTKGPDEDLDYSFDFSLELNDKSDTISSFNLDIPNDLTVSNQSSNDTAVSFYIDGGTTGTRYMITCDITTNAGRTYKRKMIINIEDR